ncbi:hypothetical protein [Actinacidiphila sp. ITFR-21]|uniref:hypothetical protein n=1 Tax=Actinacidiphila sp. ITFR-21 TaxID=3075199 RepID=UPI0028890AF6|nr:hypothetical protein [Streptomyces sp. ITFR-21]WNI16355.1 hypothetical protein RLT57_13035 [Streptomyces sp. ITFR-21]
MDVTFNCAGTNRTQDLQSLREWLPKADPNLQLAFKDPDSGTGDHLGAQVEELFAAISATADLFALGVAVRGWVHNRFGRDVATEDPIAVTSGDVTTIQVGPVTITITGGTGAPAPLIDPDES